MEVRHEVLATGSVVRVVLQCGCGCSGKSLLSNRCLESFRETAVLVLVSVRAGTRVVTKVIRTRRLSSQAEKDAHRRRLDNHCGRLSICLRDEDR